MPRPVPPSDAAPYPGARYATSIVAANVAGYRKALDLRQVDLAERMQALGHPWSQNVVTIIETQQRHVTVDELLGLAVALEVTVPDLLDPAGIAGTDERHVALLPAGAAPPAGDELDVPPQIPNGLARALIAGRAIVRIRPLDEAGVRWQLEQVGAPTSAREVGRTLKARASLGRRYQITYAPAPTDRRPTYDEATAGRPQYLAFPFVREVQP